MKREDQIRRAAYDILGTEGLENLHARTVASSLGINHATVHYYFPHREDLLVAVAEFALHQLIRDRFQFQQGADDPKERIEQELALAEAYCRPQSRFAKVLAALYVAGVAIPAVREKVVAIWNEWSEFLSEQIQSAGLKEGTPYSDPQLLTATFFGMCMASQMLDEGFDPQPRMDAIFMSMFGV